MSRNPGWIFQDLSHDVVGSRLQLHPFCFRGHGSNQGSSRSSPFMMSTTISYDMSTLEVKCPLIPVCLGVGTKGRCPWGWHDCQNWAQSGQSLGHRSMSCHVSRRSKHLDFWNPIEFRDIPSDIATFNGSSDLHARPMPNQFFWNCI